MLCIIASHANVWNYFSDNIIGAWSVFVFFFISALFIKQDSKKALNYSRFLKLFIPYLLWCLIGALIYFKFNLHAIYANMVAVFGCNIFNTFPAYGILWFLRELLLLSLVSPLLSKLNDAALLLFTVIFQILGAAPELIYHAGLDGIPFLFRLCHNKQLINSHFYRGVSELPYKLLFAVIYTHLEFRYEVSHTITSHHVHHFHQTRIPDGTLLDYMVQYRKPLFPQFFLYPKKFLPENNPHHKEFHLRPYIQNNANQ